MEMIIALTAALAFMLLCKAMRPRPYRDQEKWLQSAAHLILTERLVPLSPNGYPKTSIKIVKSLGRVGIFRRLDVLGECKYSGGRNNIEIIAGMSERQSLGVLTHELIHALDNTRSGHGGHFKRVARAAGMTGKPGLSMPGESLSMYLLTVPERIGPMPEV